MSGESSTLQQALDVAPGASAIDALPCGNAQLAGLRLFRDLDRRSFLKLASVPSVLCAAAMSFRSMGSLPAAAFWPPPETEVEAKFYDRLALRNVKCLLCPRECIVPDGARGHCQVRENRKGTYYTLVHSRICTAHVDPIEKKPLFHFLPGTMAFSVATGGCNVNCKFCQNWEISQVRAEDLRRQRVTPPALATAAQQNGCPTLAYTYSEPIIATEYYLDCAEAGHHAGLKCVFISNGFIRRDPLNRLCDSLDAIKIDLKSFSEKYYNEVVNAQLRPVLDSMLHIRKRGVWLEIVYLVVPTLNDSDTELRTMAKWVKSELGVDVPIHFSRFYPLYRLKNLPPTPLATLERAHAIAEGEGLHFVYLGNVPGHPTENTYCPKCRRAVIERVGFTVRKLELAKGKCQSCRQPIAGVWS